MTLYSYDGEGRRVKKVQGSATTVFVYNVLGQLVAEYSTQEPSGGTRYFMADPLGSTRAVTDPLGNIETRHDYLPFGEEISLVNVNYGNRLAVPGYTSSLLDGPRHKFSAKERDSESNLDYFGARYFSGAQGRFTSPDEFNGGPFEFTARAGVNPTFYADLTNPQSLNKYQYGSNNPLRYIDLDGHEPEESFLDQAVRSVGVLFDSFVSLFGSGQEDTTPNAEALMESWGAFSNSAPQLRPDGPPRCLQALLLNVET
ncbi:MAG: RHS repeat-associated core domain-containing protein [Acidobacteriota bacterium]